MGNRDRINEISRTIIKVRVALNNVQAAIGRGIGILNDDTHNALLDAEESLLGALGCAMVERDECANNG